MNNAKNVARGAASSNITRDFYQHITNSLAENPKNAIGLVHEIAEKIPEARERQIYKMLYPLVQYQCRPQLNYLTKEFILNPLFADNLKLFRGPNQYSILLMSFGYQFITDPKLKNNREVIPIGPESNMTRDGKPFRYSLFQRFARTLQEENSDLLFGEKDM
jgi:hypothetical protein